jgi:peptidoglycan/LPS O-acetylase OafA/YrhL
MFGMARFSTLFLALVIASPALYQAFVNHTLDPMTALLRYLIAIPVVALMLGVLRAITRDYGRDKQHAEKASEPPAIRAEAVTGEPLNRRSTDTE